MKNKIIFTLVLIFCSLFVFSQSQTEIEKMQVLEELQSLEFDSLSYIGKFDIHSNGEVRYTIYRNSESGLTDFIYVMLSPKKKKYEFWKRQTMQALMVYYLEENDTLFVEINESKNQIIYEKVKNLTRQHLLVELEKEYSDLAIHFSKDTIREYAADINRWKERKEDYF